jgi:hypothetical protein
MALKQMSCFQVNTTVPVRLRILMLGKLNAFGDSNRLVLSSPFRSRGQAYLIFSQLFHTTVVVSHLANVGTAVIVLMMLCICKWVTGCGLAAYWLAKSTAKVPTKHFYWAGFVFKC